MRDRFRSYFQKVQWPFVLHILAGILRHEYKGAEYNPSGLHSSQRKQTIVDFGKISQGNNQVQLYKTFSPGLCIVSLLRSELLDTKHTTHPSN